MVILAHAGAGATWQAMVVLCSFGLVVVFLGVAFGRLRIEEPGDLVLPFAGIAVLASLSGATNSYLSDWVGWWTPIGVVALVGILVHTFTPLRLTPRSPLTWGLVVVAVVSSLFLHTPLETAWHPVPTGIQRDDIEVTITTPANGTDVPIGPTVVTVQVTGGTIGPGPTDKPPVDPEELGVVQVFVDGILVADDDGRAAEPNESCAQGCTTATWDVDLARGAHVVSVEFLASDLESFAANTAGSATVDLVTIEAR